MNLGEIVGLFLEWISRRQAARDRDATITATQDEADRLARLLRQTDWEIRRMEGARGKR